MNFSICSETSSMNKNRKVIRTGKLYLRDFTLADDVILSRLFLNHNA